MRLVNCVYFENHCADLVAVAVYGRKTWDADEANASWGSVSAGNCNGLYGLVYRTGSDCAKLDGSMLVNSVGNCGCN